MDEITYSIIATVSIYALIALLPLWIGMITNHPRKLRLALVPTVPYVVAAIFTVATVIVNVADDVNGLGYESGVVATIAYAAGLSALSVWVVTWVLFKKWRKGNL